MDMPYPEVEGRRAARAGGWGDGSPLTPPVVEGVRVVVDGCGSLTDSARGTPLFASMHFSRFAVVSLFASAGVGSWYTTGQGVGDSCACFQIWWGRTATASGVMKHWPALQATATFMPVAEDGDSLAVFLCCPSAS